MFGYKYKYFCYCRIVCLAIYLYIYISIYPFIFSPVDEHTKLMVCFICQSLSIYTGICGNNAKYSTTKYSGWIWRILKKSGTFTKYEAFEKIEINGVLKRLEISIAKLTRIYRAETSMMQAVIPHWYH